MALFFFHLVSPAGYDVDEIGSEFPSVEFAYLEARAAAVEMVVEIMQDHRDLTRYQFEIVDDQGRFLMEMPFSEVIRPRAVSADLAGIRAKLHAETRRGHKLRDELQHELQKSRAVIALTQKTLARSSGS